MDLEWLLIYIRLMPSYILSSFMFYEIKIELKIHEKSIKTIKFILNRL